MATSWLKLGIVFGIFVLGVSLFAPTLIDVGERDATETVDLQQADFVELSDRLSVAAVDVQSPQDEATIRYRNERTYERTDVLLNETTPAERKTIVLSGANITAELVEIDDNQSAIVSTTYPPTFGWDDAPKTFWKNIGLVVAILAAIMILGLLALVVRI